MDSREFLKYYPFPLKEWLGIKLATAENNPACDWLVPETEAGLVLRDRILRRLNGEDVSFLEGTKFECEGIKIQAVTNSGRIVPILRVRGWGMLTGCGGFNLPGEYAAKIQDQFRDYCIEILNSSRKHQKEPL